MILGHDGERLSKRHGAVSVLQYREDGYLPEALLNYLARLGWGHGDAEKFSVQEFIQWFDVADVSHAAARFDAAKLTWLNQQYIKEADDARLAELVRPFLARQGITPDGGPNLVALVALLKERAATVEELADAAHIFYRQSLPTAEALQDKLDAAAVPALVSLRETFSIVAWAPESLNQALKDCAKMHGLKLGQIGIPLRLLLFGTAQTPSLDVTLALLGREETLRRLERAWPLIEVSSQAAAG